MTILYYHLFISVVRYSLDYRIIVCVVRYSLDYRIIVSGMWFIREFADFRCPGVKFNATFNNISVFAGSLSVDLNAFLQSLSSTSITNTSLLGTDHLTWRWGLWFFVSFRIFFLDNTRVRIFILFVVQSAEFFSRPPPLQVKWSFPYWIIRRINGQIYLMYIYFFGLSIKVWWKDFTI